MRDDGEPALVGRRDDRREGVVVGDGTGVGVERDLDHRGSGVRLRVDRRARSPRVPRMPGAVRHDTDDAVGCPRTAHRVPARSGEECARIAHVGEALATAGEGDGVTAEVDDGGDPAPRQAGGVDQVQVHVVVDEGRQHRAALAGQRTSDRLHGRQMRESSRSLDSTSAFDGSTWWLESG